MPCLVSIESRPPCLPQLFSENDNSNYAVFECHSCPLNIRNLCHISYVFIAEPKLANGWEMEVTTGTGKIC